ncbi:hypothetical protein STAS_09416 [Striga asiatica]|uniref:KIB1-4 beta-propeller domain-containing protein n=1 Tax=Striga asiatica TaxID=4170 RepID=A0A5A7PKW5_STRAF|nr:hypothetical protein STAS_09416 [Striga asiatica]
MLTSKQVDNLVVAGEDLLLVTQYVVTSFDFDGLYVDATTPYDFTAKRGFPSVTVDFDVHKYDPEDGELKYVEGSLGGWALFVGLHSHAVALPAADFPELKPNSIYFTDAKLDASIEEYKDCLTGGHDIGIFNYENKTVSPCYFPCDAQNLRKTYPGPMCAISIALAVGLVTGLPEFWIFLGEANATNIAPALPYVSVLISGPPIKGSWGIVEAIQQGKTLIAGAEVFLGHWVIFCSVEKDVVDGFPNELPEEYKNMSLLKGRATMDMRVKVKDNPNPDECVFRLVLDGYDPKWYMLEEIICTKKLMLTSKQVDNLVVAGEDLLLVTQYVVTSFDFDGLYVDATTPYDFTAKRGFPSVTVDFDVHKYDPEDGELKYVEGSLGGWALFVGLHSHAVALPAADFPELKPNSIYFTDAKLDASIEEYKDCLTGGHDIGIFNYENKTVSPCYFPCDAQNLRKTYPGPMWFFPSLGLVTGLPEFWIFLGEANATNIAPALPYVSVLISGPPIKGSWGIVEAIQQGKTLIAGAEVFLGHWVIFCSVEKDVVDGFPNELPEEYKNMSLLKGRATMDMRVKVKDNPNPDECVFRLVLDGYDPKWTGGKKKLSLTSMGAKNLVVAGEDLLVVTQYVVDAFDLDGLYVDGNTPYFCSEELGFPSVTVDFDVHKYDPEDGELKYVEGSLGGWALFVGLHSHAVALPAADFPELKPNSIYFTDAMSEASFEECNNWLTGGHDIGIFDYDNKTVSPCYFPCNPKNMRKTYPAPMWFFPTRQ